MLRVTASSFFILALAGCAQTGGSSQQILTAEPGAGQLRAGVQVLVDDGSCPVGQIKQVTGGNNAAGVGRQRECIARP